jgi:predicted membrane-bound spermidine synthase/tetratricopeptide (TPR) repeat protein
VQIAPFIAFFVSGASSLIFQLIWSRLLHHVFGSSSVAISSVVSVFMGGLALGAWLFGRMADRIRRPLLVYAWAELGVGLFAMCVPLFVSPDGVLADVNAFLHRHFGSGSLALMLARFACIAPVLIVPTTLMGSTLPLLARHFVSNTEHASSVSRRVGALYAVNTLGAVSGVFLAGFVLMPNFGVAAANRIAVLMNITLALGIFVLRRRLGEAGQREAIASVSSSADVGAGDDALPPFPPRVRTAAALAFAFSGFCSLLYEVVWSRALVNTIGGSVYSFALILMTFLVGIAGGSAAAARCLGDGPARARSVLGFGVALCVAAALPWGVQFGFFGWATASACGVLLVLCGELLGRRRLRERALLEEDVALVDGPGAGSLELWPLAPPVLLALTSAVYFHSRLAGLLLSAVLLAALLLAALVLLRRRLVLLLAGTQLFIAVATLVSDAWADQISLAFAAMVVPFYHALGEHVDRVMAMMFATAALCVLPSALGMGAMFPLTMRVFSAGGARVGREVSAVYTGNTLGSIAGAWLPGFVLMPVFGMQATLHVGIAINLLLGLCVLLAERAPSPRGRALQACLVPAVVLLVGGLGWASVHRSPLRWNLTKMTLGVFRISLAKDVLDQETWGEPDLMYYRDGLSTTVSVERWGRHYSLKNNGKVEASNGDDMPTQIMVSALPLLLHGKGARGLDAAIIGLGSGVTVGAAMQFPLRSLEVIELERAVAEGSRFFAEANHLQYALPDFPYVQMPRLSLINDDGRNYLASTDKRYDVIVGEPSNPWLTGVSDLFTVDHFRIAKRKLRPGGVYCEWVQLYEMSPENVKIIYRTFASQFRHVVVFSAEDLSSDTVLVGSDEPLAIDLAHLRAGFAAPGVAAELERAYVHSPFDVLARVLLSSRDEVMRYTQVEAYGTGGAMKAAPSSTNEGACAPPNCWRTPSPLNTDDNALIEFAAPRDLIGFERYKGYLQTIYAESWPYGSLKGRLSGLSADPAARAEEHAELTLALLAHGRRREAARVLDSLGDIAPPSAGAVALADTPPVRFARAMLDALGPAPIEPSPHLHPPRPDPEVGDSANARLLDGYTQALAWLERGEPKRAKEAVEAIPSSLLHHAGAEMQYLRAYTLYRAGDHDLAIGDLEALARGEPAFVLQHPELYFFLGRAHEALQHFDKAVRSARVYVEAQVQAARAAQPEEDEAGPVPQVSDAPGESEKAFQPGSPG